LRVARFALGDERARAELERSTGQRHHSAMMKIDRLILKEYPTALVARSIMMKIGEVGLKIKINIEALARSAIRRLPRSARRGSRRWRSPR
jgi:hypothetical protein